MQIIPLPEATAFFQLRSELDGTSYLLDFAWNERQAAWIMSILTADGDPLVHGITCVSNRALLRRFKSIEGLPPGDLMAVDLTRTIDVADYTQFGKDVELTYYTAEEVAGLPNG